MRSSPSSSAPLTGSSRGGFTLIELLVVISIILLLAAIALPVLARASRQARGVQCVGNVRQLAAAGRSYATAYDGILPGTYGCGTPTWFMDPDPHSNPALSFANTPQKGQLFPFYNDERLVRCPSDREGNGRFSYSCPINIRYRMIDMVEQPSAAVLIMEEHERYCIGGFIGPSVVPERREDGFACGDRPANRHGGCAGVAYFDGRAALVRYPPGTTAWDIEIKPWGAPCGQDWTPN